MGPSAGFLYCESACEACEYEVGDLETEAMNLGKAFLFRLCFSLCSVLFLYTCFGSSDRRSVAILCAPWARAVGHFGEGKRLIFHEAENAYWITFFSNWWCFGKKRIRDLGWEHLGWEHLGWERNRQGF